MRLNAVRRATAAGVALVLIGGVGAWIYKGSAATGLAEAAAQPPRGAAADPSAVTLAAGAPQLTMIRSEAVHASVLPVSESLSARVAYDEDRTARISASVSGRVLKVFAAPGDVVHAGQALAEIDAPDFGAARSDVAKARSDEERKRLAFERARELGAGEGIAAKDFESARADYEAARAETARAQQRLANLEPRGTRIVGEHFVLTSPFDGVVAERTASPSLEVGPGMSSPLFVVTDVRRLWLLIDLPESLLARVRPGSLVSVESDAYPGEQFHARIARRAPVMDPNTRRVLARANLDNPAGRLLPEMLVRASVAADSGQAIRVPVGSIVDRGIYSYVFVEARPGDFQRRRVHLVARGADAAFVDQGLAEGDHVVTRGALLLDAESAAVPPARP